ncbi:MAG: hypothetical protein U0575_13025 [Phycisphaerales bacterium]
MLQRQQIIDRIREVNVTARVGWLGQFDEPQLRHYLDHLNHTLEPRGRASHWIRRGTTPALLVHTPDD